MTRPVFLILLAAASWRAAAQEVVLPGQERWTIMLGAFLPAFKSKMQVDNAQLGSGDRVDLGSDLGVDENTSGAWIGAEWRFAPRHRVGFTYSRFTLRGDRTLDRNLQIGDELFPAGATVASSLRLEIIPIAYSYSLVKRPQDELALTAGLHWSSLRFTAEGSASLSNLDLSRDASAKANVPLPLFGVRYDYHFGPRWSAGANLAAFALKFGESTWNFEGTLWSARVHAEYRFARNFALGAAIDGFRVKVDVSKSDWNGGFDYGYFGPQIYLMSRF